MPLFFFRGKKKSGRSILRRNRFTYWLAAHRFQSLWRDAREGFLKPFDTGDSLLRSVSLHWNVADPLLISRMTYYQSFTHNAVRFGTHCLFQNYNILESRSAHPLPCSPPTSKFSYPEYTHQTWQRKGRPYSTSTYLSLSRTENSCSIRDQVTRPDCYLSTSASCYSPSYDSRPHYSNL